MSKPYRADWHQIQKLRDEGAEVKDLASRFKINPTSIYTQTRKRNMPSKWRNNDGGIVTGMTQVEQLFKPAASAVPEPGGHAANGYHVTVATLIKQHEKSIAIHHDQIKEHERVLSHLRQI